MVCKLKGDIKTENISLWLEYIHISNIRVHKHWHVLRSGINDDHTVIAYMYLSNSTSQNILLFILTTAHKAENLAILILKSYVKYM